MATLTLSEGAISAICAAADGSAGDLQPVLQVADIQLLNQQNTKNYIERYQLLISDGVHSQQSMLVTKRNDLIKNGTLQKGSIIRLLRFTTCNILTKRTIIIISDLEVLKHTCPLIGVAKSYIPQNASVPPSVGQAEASPAHVRRGNSHATVPDSTYLTSEAGRLLQPKLESAAQLQSYGNIVGSGPSSREKDLAVRCFKCRGFGHFQSACPNKRTVTLREAISLRNELYNEACDEEALFLVNREEEAISVHNELYDEACDEEALFLANREEEAIRLRNELYNEACDEEALFLANREEEAIRLRNELYDEACDEEALFLTNMEEKAISLRNDFTKYQVNDRCRSLLNHIINGDEIVAYEAQSHETSVVLHRRLHTQPEPVMAEQLGQNFHTKGHVNDRCRNLINLIINGGSCTNVPSSELKPKIVPVAPTVTLSEGSIAALCSCSDDRESDMKPVMQIADIRLVNTQSTICGTTGNVRYRLMLSDGVHMQQGMLATQHNDLVRNGHLQKGSLVQLLSFICNKLQNRMIIVITKLEVLQEKCPLIGEPKPYQP